MGPGHTVKDKEELIKTILKLVDGKEASTKLNLRGIEFRVGKSAVRINGTIEITFTPAAEKE